MGQVSKIDYENYAKKQEETAQVVDKKEGYTEI